MTTPDPDQLLALALTRRCHLQTVTTHEEIRAAARRARTQAAKVREELRGARDRFEALRVETTSVRRRLGTARADR